MYADSEEKTSKIISMADLIGTKYHSYWNKYLKFIPTICLESSSLPSFLCKTVSLLVYNFDRKS